MKMMMITKNLEKSQMKKVTKLNKEQKHSSEYCQRLSVCNFSAE
jgi:hypothetical protein